MQGLVLGLLEFLRGLGASKLARSWGFGKFIGLHLSGPFGLGFGVFPLILTVRNRDDSTPLFESLLRTLRIIKGGTSQNRTL